MTSAPAKIGEYEIVREFGRGSRGTVYSARGSFSARLVALKLAHPRYLVSRLITV